MDRVSNIELPKNRMFRIFSMTSLVVIFVSLRRGGRIFFFFFFFMVLHGAKHISLFCHHRFFKEDEASCFSWYYYKLPWIISTGIHFTAAQAV